MVSIQNTVSCLCNLSRIPVYAWQTINCNLPLTIFWVQGKQSRAESVDAQWRAAAHGYAAQVLHPERYHLTFQICHCTVIPWVFSHTSTEKCNPLPACLPAYALICLVKISRQYLPACSRTDASSMLTASISHLRAFCLSALSDLHWPYIQTI